VSEWAKKCGGVVKTRLSAVVVRTWGADAREGVGAVGRYVEVAQLDRLEELALVAVHEDVRALDVAVEDLVAVEVVQPARHLRRIVGDLLGLKRPGVGTPNSHHQLCVCGAACAVVRT
jgi:hypothetical protein